MQSSREFQVRRDELLASATGRRPRVPSCPDVLPDHGRSLVDGDAGQPKRVAAVDPLPNQPLRRNSIKSIMSRSAEARALSATASLSLEHTAATATEQPQAVVTTESDQSNSSVKLRASNTDRPLINLSALRRNSLTAFRAQTTESDESNQRYEAMMERFQLRLLQPSASFSMGGSQQDLIRGVHTDSFAAPPLASDLEPPKRPRGGSGSGTALLDRELSGSSLLAAPISSAESGEAPTLFTRKTSRTSFRRSVSVSSGVHDDEDEQLPDRAYRPSLNPHTSFQPSIVDEDDHAHEEYDADPAPVTASEAAGVSRPRQEKPVAVSTLSRMLSRLTRPLSPIGTFAALRYAVLAAAVMVYFVWLPFKVAFVGYSEDTCLDWLDLPVEFSFLLDSLLHFNTAFVSESGELVTTRARIAWNYVTGWFLFDLLSSVPLRLIFSLDPQMSSAKRFAQENSIYDGVMRSGRLVHAFLLLRFVWLIRMHRTGKTRWSWFFYSQYSHLLRIWGIVAMIVLMAHYVACIWRSLSPPLLRPYPSRADDYAANFYAALQLLQGQGLTTQTTQQNTFASYAILTGSVTLALVFGHVAILISNFNANSTSYQRKMEAVFSIMNKLQLPVLLRERIHEYYEYLWREYESLDGKIVGFSKGLTHTLGLEVALFKYMELVMHVPYWLDCSTDFQKQLILNLQVRVYLPDDFVIRQGEVGDEMYMINRGQCELVATDNKTTTEHPVYGSTPMKPNQQQAEKPGKPGTSQRRGSWTARSQTVTARAPPPSTGFTSVLRQGQWFGEMALIMNHQRSADVRAAAYVEMCVLKREDFQTIITRYPEDRMRVIERLMLAWMKKNEAYGAACPMLRMVQEVYEGEEVSLEEAAKLLAQGIDDDGLDDDGTLLFGIDSQFKQRVEEAQAQAGVGEVRTPVPAAASTTTTAAVNGPRGPILPEDDLDLDSEAMASIRLRMLQMEESQRAMLQVMRDLGMELTQLHNIQEQMYGGVDLNRSPRVSSPRRSSHRESSRHSSSMRPSDHTSSTPAPASYRDHVPVSYRDNTSARATILRQRSALFASPNAAASASFSTGARFQRRWTLVPHTSTARVDESSTDTAAFSGSPPYVHLTRPRSRTLPNIFLPELVVPMPTVAEAPAALATVPAILEEEENQKPMTLHRANAVKTRRTRPSSAKRPALRSRKSTNNAYAQAAPRLQRMASMANYEDIPAYTQAVASSSVSSSSSRGPRQTFLRRVSSMVGMATAEDAPTSSPTQYADQLFHRTG